jgi:hypothetical protein
VIRRSGPPAHRVSRPQTIVVNGELWDRSVDVMQFIQSHITVEETPAG